MEPRCPPLQRRSPFPRFVLGLQFNIEDAYGFYPEAASEDFIAGLAERLHADLVIVFARDGWGRAFYPSRLYPRHPLASRLSLRGLAERLQRSGKSLVVMACHTANRFLAELHPGWVQRGPGGEPRTLDHHPSRWRGAPEWPLICPNSPAGELCPREAGEALDETGARGLLLDSLRYMPDPGRACYCKWCREAFRGETGLELPQGGCSPGEECWEAYREAWEWRYRVTRRLVEAVAGETRERGAWLLYNNHPGGWSGRGLRFTTVLHDLLDAVFAEASEEDYRGPWWRSFIVKASWAVSGGKPVLSTRNAFPLLRPPSSAPPVVLEHGLWSIVAAGASPVLTVFASTAAEDPRFVDTVARVYAEMDSMRSLLEEREPIADVALLYSGPSHDWHIHSHPEAYIGELMGLAKGLSMLHTAWGVVDASKPWEAEALGAGIVVAADTGVEEPGLEEWLEELLDNGAAVLMTGFPGTRGPGLEETHRVLLQDRLAAAYEGRMEPGAYHLDTSPWPGHGPPRLVSMGAPDPLFRERRWDPWLGEAARIRPMGARVLAYMRPPRSSYGHEYTLGRSTPAPAPEQGPPLVVESPGGGLLYHGYRLGLHIHRLGLPDHLALLEASLARLGLARRRRVWLEEAMDLVEMHAYRVGEGLLVHLVNNCWHRIPHAVPEATTPGSAPGFEPARGLTVPRRPPGCGGLVLAARAEPGQRLLARLHPGGGEETLEADEEGVARLRLRLDQVHLAVHLAPRS